MTLEARKLEFIQEFLKLQSEETIALFERILNRERVFKYENNVEPMAIKELDKRIDQSEADFKALKFKNSEELLKKYN